MTREQGKRLWGFLKRVRSVPIEVWVFQDEGDGRALSVAMGVCDAMNLKRKEHIYQVGAPDSLNDEQPPNKYVYEMTKLAKSLVM